MITDNLKKPLAILCLLLALLILLASCDERQDTYDYIFSDNEEETQESAKFISILPADCSAELYEAATQLCGDLELRTGASVRLLYDYEELNEDEYDRIILIGNTSYAQSKSFLRGFRANDYGYSCIGKTILIGGLCDSAALNAIEKFNRDIVRYASKDFLINDKTEYIFNDEYDIEKILLNGFELCDYTLVYHEGNAEAYLSALDFRDKLASASGYYLELKSDSDVPSQIRAISVGKTELGGNYITGVSESDVKFLEHPTGISLIAATPYGMEKLSDKLLSLLTEADSSGIADVKISTESLFLFNQKDIKLIDLRFESPDLSMSETIEISKMISAELPEIIRLSGASQNAAKRVITSAGTDYEMLMLSGNNECGVYHIYLKSKYDAALEESLVFEGGTLSSITYKSKSDNMAFSVYTVYSDATDNVEYAENAAELLSEAIKSSDSEHNLITSSFEGGAEVAFSAKLDSLNRFLDGIYASENTFSAKINTPKPNAHTILLTIYY